MTNPIDELIEKLSPLLPVVVNETPDYAELTFGTHQTQAMTMDPRTWLALNELPAALTSLQERNRKLEDALKPFAAVGLLLARGYGPAGWKEYQAFRDGAGWLENGETNFLRYRDFLRASALSGAGE